MKNNTDRKLEKLSMEERLSNLVDELKVELPNIKKEDIENIINVFNILEGKSSDINREYTHLDVKNDLIDLKTIKELFIILYKKNIELFTEKFSHLLNSRENILELNPDSIYGVYDLREQNDKGYELEYLDNVMTCYENQYNDLKGKEFIDPNITILNIGSLRNGIIEILHGNKDIKINNPVLLSNGVVEYVGSEYLDIESKEKKSRKHIITTLRDGGASDQVQRTSIAGRNSSGDLYKDLEQEHIGEAPFLGKNKDGEYVLCVSDNSIDKINFLEEGIVKFLDEKYKAIKGVSNEKKSSGDNIIKLFEKSFPGIKYEELGEILEDIMSNNRYLKYETKTGYIKGLDDDMKKIKMGDIEGEFFVYHDKTNNTIEYRKVLEITKTPEDFIPISKRPGRLYLESENQHPKSPRIDNANNIHKLVPTIKYLCEKAITNQKVIPFF